MGECNDRVGNVHVGMTFHHFSVVEGMAECGFGDVCGLVVVRG